jgi:hypothetical protein
VELDAHRAAYDAARTVAANDVSGPDLEPLVATLHRDPHRVCVVLVDLEVDDLDAVVGREPGRRADHVLEQQVERSRLVHDEVWELREPVLGVLDTARPDVARRVLIIGRQKTVSLTQ